MEDVLCKDSLVSNMTESEGQEPTTEGNCAVPAPPGRQVAESCSPNWDYILSQEVRI